MTTQAGIKAGVAWLTPQLVKYAKSLSLPFGLGDQFVGKLQSEEGQAWVTFFVNGVQTQGEGHAPAPQAATSDYAPQAAMSAAAVEPPPTVWVLIKRTTFPLYNEAEIGRYVTFAEVLAALNQHVLDPQWFTNYWYEQRVA